jgi:hypothetical protein
LKDSTPSSEPDSGTDGTNCNDGDYIHDDTVGAAEEADIHETATETRKVAGKSRTDRRLQYGHQKPADDEADQAAYGVESHSAPPHFIAAKNIIAG